jgi:hypothetical protein
MIENHMLSRAEPHRPPSSLIPTHLHPTLILALQTVKQSIGQLVPSLLDGHPSKSVFSVSMSTDLGSKRLGDFLQVQQG